VLWCRRLADAELVGGGRDGAGSDGAPQDLELPPRRALAGRGGPAHGASAVSPPESWCEQVTGKGWGINIRGEGTTHHESGNFRGMYEQTFGPNGEIANWTYTDLRWRGNATKEVQEICDHSTPGRQSSWHRRPRTKA
jgi:hypothetical protein